MSLQLSNYDRDRFEALIAEREEKEADDRAKVQALVGALLLALGNHGSVVVARAWKAVKAIRGEALE